MIPHERSLVERYQGRPFVLLGVNLDQNDDQARKLIVAKNMSWRHWRNRDRENPIHRRWNVDRLPTVYVLDADGVVRHTRLTGPALDQAIETLVAEAESKGS